MPVRRHKKRKYWEADVTVRLKDGSKVRIRRRSPRQTREGAREYERYLIREILDPSPPRKEVPTVDEYADDFLNDYAENETKKSTVDTYRAVLNLYIRPVVGKMKLDAIARSDIARIKTYMRERELSDKTTKNALAVLGKLLRYAEECEVIDMVPRIKLPKVGESPFDFLKFDEADRLLAAARGTQWYGIIHTALRTGMRFGELTELRWGDVDLVAGRIMVRRGFYRGRVTTPKSGKPREIPLSPATVLVLKKERHLRHMNADALVFCKPDGGRRIHRRADVALKRLCRKADLRSISYHVLRHTFASHLVMRGVPLKAVQELLGHADIKMTMRYAHMAPEVKREAVMVLDEPASGFEGFRGTPVEPTENARLECSPTGRNQRVKQGRGGRDSNPRPPA